MCANSYAECGILGFKPKLSDHMKNILVNTITIPVKSGTLASVASFKNLYIVNSVNEERVTETGSRIDFESLKGATGHAVVDFTISTELTDIPTIANDINSNFSCIKNGLIISKPKGKLFFYNAGGAVLGTHEFELKKGRNVVTYCDMDDFTEKVDRVWVEINSWNVELLSNRTMSW